MKQKNIVIFISIVASIRVSFFILSFPFFNNVDEIMHFDLIVKYYKANSPKGLETLSNISTNHMASLGSTEYGSELSKKELPRLISQNYNIKIKEEIKGLEGYWSERINYDCGMPPLYYATCALWIRLGQAVGLVSLDHWFVLYWIRLLNVIIIILLVICSFKIVSEILPNNQFVKFGTPFLISLFPQDIFYSIQNDVLSPLIFSLALLYSIRLCYFSNFKLNNAFLAAIFTVALPLTKFNNLALMFLLIGFVCSKYFNSKTNQIEGFSIDKLVIYLASIFIPLIIFLIWNKHHFGDFFASEQKLKYLGWKHKKITEIFDSILFTSASFKQFCLELFSSFWRGEFFWFGSRIASIKMDFFYTISTSICIGLASINIFKMKRSIDKEFLLLSLVSFLCAFIVIITISLAFKFPPNACPSESQPYFANGRLMSGILVPFLILYLMGFEFLFSFFKNQRIKYYALILFGLLICFNEIYLCKDVFQSNYNFFGLLGY